MHPYARAREDWAHLAWLVRLRASEDARSAQFNKAMDSQDAAMNRAARLGHLEYACALMDELGEDGVLESAESDWVAAAQVSTMWMFVMKAGAISDGDT